MVLPLALIPYLSFSNYEERDFWKRAEVGASRAGSSWRAERQPASEGSLQGPAQRQALKQAACVWRVVPDAGFYSVPRLLCPKSHTYTHHLNYPPAGALRCCHFGFARSSSAEAPAALTEPWYCSWFTAMLDAHYYFVYLFVCFVCFYCYYLSTFFNIQP